MLNHSYQHTVLVACDSMLASQTLAWGLECHLKNCRIIHVHSLDDLTHRFHIDAPAMVLMDENMAMRAARILSGFVSVRVGNSRLVVVADELTQSQLHYVVHNRLSGIVTRRRSLPEFANDLTQILAGHSALPEEHVQEVRVGRDGFLEIIHEVATTLTDRQLQVLIRVAEGCSVRDLAKELRISEKSVESHKYRAMKTLQIADRVGLCRWAIREGLINA